MDLALNNLQRLICHKTKQTKPIMSDKWSVKYLNSHWMQADIGTYLIGEAFFKWTFKFTYYIGDTEVTSWEIFFRDDKVSYIEFGIIYN